MAYTAKKAGLEVCFLPHGIMYDYQYLKTGGEFGMNKILTWNQSNTIKLKKEGKKIPVNNLNRKNTIIYKIN